MILSLPNAVIASIQDKPKSILGEFSSRLKIYTIKESEKAQDAFMIELDPTKIPPCQVGTRIALEILFEVPPEWTNPYKIDNGTVDVTLHGKFDHIKILKEKTTTAKAYFFDVGVILDYTNRFVLVPETEWNEKKGLFNNNVTVHMSWLK